MISDAAKKGPAANKFPGPPFPGPPLKKGNTHELLAIFDIVGEMVDTQIRAFTGISLRAMGKVGFRITQIIAVILVVILISIVGRSFVAYVESIDFKAQSPGCRFRKFWHS